MHKHINYFDYTIDNALWEMIIIFLFFVVVIKHISLNHLGAHSRSVLKGLYIITKNLFLYGVNEWDFVELYLYADTIPCFNINM